MNADKDHDPKSDKPESESLIPIHVPALVAVLLNQEKSKGAPLTEAEVLEIRDKAVCIVVPLDVVQKMAESRGYDDIDPADVWNQWQLIRESLHDHL